MIAAVCIGVGFAQNLILFMVLGTVLAVLEILLGMTDHGGRDGAG